VTEENVQGGISKIQAADNVIALIPDSTTRQAGMMRAKILKSRDSSGVGKYIQFQAKWSTLTFEPFENENDDDSNQYKGSNKKNNNETKEFSRREPNKNKKMDLRRDSKKKVILSEDNPVEKNNNEKKVNNTRSVIKNLKGRNKPYQKIVKSL